MPKDPKGIRKGPPKALKINEQSNHFSNAVDYRKVPLKCSQQSMAINNKTLQKSAYIWLLVAMTPKNGGALGAVRLHVYEDTLYNTDTWDSVDNPMRILQSTATDLFFLLCALSFWDYVAENAC